MPEAIISAKGTEAPSKVGEVHTIRMRQRPADRGATASHDQARQTRMGVMARVTGQAGQHVGPVAQHARVSEHAGIRAPRPARPIRIRQDTGRHHAYRRMFGGPAVTDAGGQSGDPADHEHKAHPTKDRGPFRQSAPVRNPFPPPAEETGGHARERPVVFEERPHFDLVVFHGPV